MPRNIRGSSVPERTSRFVLEVLPYLLCALIAAVVVPGFLYSQVQGTKVTLIPTGLEMIQRDHAAVSAPAQMLSDRPTEGAKDKVAYR
jgi:hypothetical protein